MKKFISAIITLTMLLSLFSVLSVSAFAFPDDSDITLYVSADASADGQGTLSDPVSLQGAKDKLKTMKETVVEGDKATVYLMGGTYSVDDTIKFTADDMPNVTYKAYDKNRVEITGAKPITGFTESTANGVKVFTKKIDKTVGVYSFKSLFSDTNELRVPRFPEEGYFTVKATAPEDDIWTEENRPWEYTLGQRSFYGDTADLTVDFRNPQDVNVRILHFWHDELAFIKNFDKASGKVTMSRPSSMLIQDFDRYYFENVFEALNEPGEWYLDSQEGLLYYVPFEGEKADTLTLYGSDVEQLIEINGVNGISFENIAFTRTDWEIPSKGSKLSMGDWSVQNDMDFPQAALDVKGVVTVNYAENIHFKNCEFTDLGASGLKFMDGVKNSSVENSYFENIAATAIYAGGMNCLPDEPDYTSNITIKNNEIYKYGRKFYCAIGIHITYCDTAEVVNNEIHDGYYTGISCGWVWGYAYHVTKNINISRNLIYNIGQGWLSDMGGIYMLGKQPGTVLSENVIHNVAADPGEGGYGGWGIYLDEGSSFMSVEKNLVYACGSQSLNIHYGEGNVIRNNIAALSAEGQVNPGIDKGESHATAMYYNNIFLTNENVPIYINMLNTSHFYDNSNVMWSLSKGDDLCFKIRDDIINLSTAQKEGYINYPIIEDPGFKDAKNFDFALTEESPAVASNFEIWDYSVAGTIEGTIIGLTKEGGKTPYNAEAKAQPIKEITGEMFPKHLSVIVSVLPVILLLVWVIIGIVRPERRSVICILCALLTTVLFPVIIHTYLEWIQLTYFLSIFVLGALSAVMMYFIKDKWNRSKKNKIISTVVTFVLSSGLTLGIAGIMNMLLSSGTVPVIGVALCCEFVFMVVETILLAKKK